MSDHTPDAAGSPRPRRIVVGVDGSRHSTLALRRAAALAEADGIALDPVIVWQQPATATGAPLAGWDPGIEAGTVLRDALAEVFGPALPAWVHPRVLPGATARVLIDASAGAELLVVGSRGHGGFAGLLLGSVSSACAEYAHCPVLVMREVTTA